MNVRLLIQIEATALTADHERQIDDTLIVAIIQIIAQTYSVLPNITVEHNELDTGASQLIATGH